MFCVLSICLIVSWLAFFNLSNTVDRGSAQACRTQKKNLHKYADVSVELPNGNGNVGELGIARWEKWKWNLFQMKMGVDENGNSH